MNEEPKVDAPINSHVDDIKAHLKQHISSKVRTILYIGLGLFVGLFVITWISFRVKNAEFRNERQKYEDAYRFKVATYDSMLVTYKNELAQIDISLKSVRDTLASLRIDMMKTDSTFKSNRRNYEKDKNKFKNLPSDQLDDFFDTYNKDR